MRAVHDLMHTWTLGPAITVTIERALIFAVVSEALIRLPIRDALHDVLVSKSTKTILPWRDREGVQLRTRRGVCRRARRVEEGKRQLRGN